jgi:hypothetical protein
MLLALGLLLTPFVVVQSLLLWRLHSTLEDCDAVVMDDECHYWNEIDTYRTVGWSGGYFVDAERTAPAAWTHFGPHGPAYPVLVGTFARVFGWGTASGPVFNLAAIGIGMLAWLVLVRPDAKHLAAALLLVATFWPFPLYVPATLQECLHYAIAFVLAGLAQRAVNGAGPTAGTFWPFLVVVALASLLRITWTLVLIPWILVALRGSGLSWKLLASVATVAVVAGVGMAWQRISSPYPNFLAAVFEVTGGSLPGQARLLWDHIRTSCAELFSFHDRPLETLQRYEVLTLIALSAIAILRPQGRLGGARVAATVFAVSAALVAVRGEMWAGMLLTVLAAARTLYGRPLATFVVSVLLAGVLYFLATDVLAAQLLGDFWLVALKFALTVVLFGLQRDLVAKLLLVLGQLLRLEDDLRPYLFVGLNLALLLVAVVTLYDVEDWRDYRVVAPHLLLSLLLLVSGSACRWAVCVAAVNLLFLPALAVQFETSHRIRVDHDRTRRVIIDLRKDLAYDPAARSPWANTVLVPEVDSSNRVRVPAGVGVCWVVPYGGGGRLTLPIDSPYFIDIQNVGEDWLALPPKSLYVFAKPYRIRAWKGCHFERIKELPQGNLYLNRDSPAYAESHVRQN